MPTKTWPLTLPQRVMVDGYTEKPPNLLLRSQPQKGPAIVRRYTSAGVRAFTANVMVQGWQLHILDSFFMDDLAGGLWPFWMPHPREGVTTLTTLGGVDITTEDGEEIVTGYNIIVRMVEPPTYTANGPVVFQAAMSLEAMP